MGEQRRHFTIIEKVLNQTTEENEHDEQFQPVQIKKDSSFYQMHFPSPFSSKWILVNGIRYPFLCGTEASEHLLGFISDTFICTSGKLYF